MLLFTFVKRKKQTTNQYGRLHSWCLHNITIYGIKYTICACNNTEIVWTDYKWYILLVSMSCFQAWKFCYCINHTCIWISSFVYLLFGLGLEGTQPHDYRNPLCHLQLSFKVILNSSNSALLITTTTNLPWKRHLNIMSHCLKIVYFQW